jgi:2-oxo-3-hexenedioate decarboxylase
VTRAADLLQARDRAARIPLPSTMPGGLSLDDAYRLAAEVDDLRRARGEQPRGWKIGFTNRSIWQRYGVHQPIWGRVWDSTLTLLEQAEAEVSLAGLVQPRIEPEVVFGLKNAPRPDMDLRALQDCIEWVAHGVEIVHTHFEGWRFGGAADTVADFGLHGRLLVGPRVPVARWSNLGTDLAALGLGLWKGDIEVDRGHGALVLDGPLSALRQWLQAVHAQCPGVAVRGGEVVTTGTLTDAWPVAPGEVWCTRPDDTRLSALRLAFVA